ncbi:SusC/RagA family TonB-linked outer membrane protein [Mucilaginibacter terrae]|uniref:TonB-linked SusC/RagA family outer membrane protein n=1 Tax=Mucilaginibacter terrae TaxID=1955052 RepID=A0ABU3GWX0_9SPHI|nr:SusC/RagA family TonB-linked outer membrane protein [Mucilaginibacter terrae]MDT3404254.1 TonB-linked SusC/RagA family outer membrane protein [Mucilaginibacter terrae]
MKSKIILFLSLFLSITANAQQVITGQVLSADDKRPLVGATVQLNQSSNVVITDAKGNFHLPALKNGDVLYITFTGYEKREVRLDFPVSIPLTLSMTRSNRQLQEVTISTGYQNVPRERATGSFSSIDSKTFNQQVSPNILSRLPAIANGLTVDRGTNAAGQLTIRGLSSIRGPKDPLIVVDNFPYDGNINNINPNEVENITILKDAAAASIWGARAGNGVIVITTKKGRQNQPLTIDWNANVSIGDKPDLGQLRQMSSSDFIDAERFLFGQNYYRTQINSSSRPALSPVVELLNQQATGAISAAEANRQIDQLRSLDIRDDFDRYLYRRAVSQQYALSLRGGTDKVTWTAFAGYDRNVTNLDAVSDRKNLRFSTTFRPVAKLQLLAGIYYTDGSNRSGRPGYGDVTSRGPAFYPYAQFADASGNALPIVKDYRASYLATAGNGRLLDWRYYPLEDYKHDSTKGRLQDVLVNAGLTYDLPFGLKADVKYQYERQQNPSDHLYDAESFYSRNLVNLYTSIAANGTLTNNVPKGGIIDYARDDLEAHNFRGQLNFDRQLGVHEISAIAGTEIRNSHTTGQAFRLFGYDPGNLSFGNVDLTRQYPTFVTGAASFIPSANGLSERNTRFVSYYANGAYTYDRKYALSLSARRDASNLFGLNTNDQWNPFWSTGLSWEASRENFFKVKAVNYLRLRATYGQSGNINPSMVAVTTIAYLGLPSPYTNLPYSRFDNYANPELRWETSKMLNIAADFRAFGDALTGSIEYYHKKGQNLFGLAPIDYTTGVGASIVRNVAGMSGHGLDIQLNSRNLNSEVRWNTTLNYSRYKDKVTDYYLADQQANRFVSTDATSNITGLTGYPVYSVFGYRTAGLDPGTGAPRGYVGGEISQNYAALTGPDVRLEDLRYFGSAIPTSFGSLINTLAIGDLELNFSISYKFGYYFHRSSINYSQLGSSWAGHSDYAQRWQQPGDEARTSVPSFSYPLSSSRSNFYAGSETLVEKADHVRLQYVTLSYTLEQSKHRFLPVRRLQIYGSANNLGILWRANKQGLDPDFSYGTAFRVADPRIYSIGLRTTL